MAQQTPPKWRKVAFQATAGAVFGAVSVLAAGWLFKPLVRSGAIVMPDGSGMVAAAIGALYLMMSLSVGIGVLGPSMGAKILNVEDEEELRMQRRMLAYSTCASAAMGIALVVLAFAGPGGNIPANMALVATLVLFAASVPLTLVQWRHMDELLRKVSAEAGLVTYYLLLLIGGGWALLAHLDYAPAPASLDWLSMMFGFVLLASFIAAGRRGMLMPR